MEGQILEELHRSLYRHVDLLERHHEARNSARVTPASTAAVGRGNRNTAGAGTQPKKRTFGDSNLIKNEPDRQAGPPAKKQRRSERDTLNGPIPVEINVRPTALVVDETPVPAISESTRNWSNEECEALKIAYEEFGNGNWELMASKVATRSGEQCRTKVYKLLREGYLDRNGSNAPPVINSEKRWTLAEQHLLVEAHKAHPGDWTAIVKMVGTRTLNQCVAKWEKRRVWQGGDKHDKIDPSSRIETRSAAVATTSTSSTTRQGNEPATKKPPFRLQDRSKASSTSTGLKPTEQDDLNAPPWTEEEVDALLIAYNKFGHQKWEAVALAVPTKTLKECRLKVLRLMAQGTWISRVTDGGTKVHVAWTDEDLLLLERAHQLHGSDWEMVSKMVGRWTAQQCQMQFLNLERSERKKKASGSVTPNESSTTVSTRRQTLASGSATLPERSVRVSMRTPTQAGSVMPPETTDKVSTRMQTQAGSVTPPESSGRVRIMPPESSGGVSNSHSDETSIARLRATPWTNDEFQLLFKACHDHGDDWEAISKMVGSRSANACRAKWRYTPRKDKKLGNDPEGEDFANESRLNVDFVDPSSDLEEESSSPSSGSSDDTDGSTLDLPVGPEETDDSLPDPAVGANRTAFCEGLQLEVVDRHGQECPSDCLQFWDYAQKGWRSQECPIRFLLNSNNANQTQCTQCAEARTKINPRQHPFLFNRTEASPGNVPPPLPSIEQVRAHVVSLYHSLGEASFVNDERVHIAAQMMKLMKFDGTIDFVGESVSPSRGCGGTTKSLRLCRGFRNAADCQRVVIAQAWDGSRFQLCKKCSSNLERERSNLGRQRSNLEREESNFERDESNFERELQRVHIPNLDLNV